MHGAVGPLLIRSALTIRNDTTSELSTSALSYKRNASGTAAEPRAPK